MMLLDVISAHSDVWTVYVDALLSLPAIALTTDTND